MLILSKPWKFSNTSIRSPRSLRLDKLNKEEEEEEYKGRTDSNTPTGPNETTSGRGGGGRRGSFIREPRRGVPFTSRGAFGGQMYGGGDPGEGVGEGGGMLVGGRGRGGEGREMGRWRCFSRGSETLR